MGRESGFELEIGDGFKRETERREDATERRRERSRMLRGSTARTNRAGESDDVKRAFMRVGFWFVPTCSRFARVATEYKCSLEHDASVGRDGSPSVELIGRALSRRKSGIYGKTRAIALRHTRVSARFGREATVAKRR